MVVPLDDFDEEGRPVLAGLAEYLKEVAVLVEIHQNVQLL